MSLEKRSDKLDKKVESEKTDKNSREDYISFLLGRNSAETGKRVETGKPVFQKKSPESIKPEFPEALKELEEHMEVPDAVIAPPEIKASQLDDIDLSNEEIEKKIKFAKDTFRTPGIAPEGLSYWADVKKNKRRRDKALWWGGQRAKIKKTIAEINGKVLELTDELKEAAKYMIGYDEIKKEISQKIDALKTQRAKFQLKMREFGQAFFDSKLGDRVRDIYRKNKDKAKSVWGWLGERAMGSVTGGIWEFKHGLKMQIGSKKTATMVEELSYNIKEEGNLSETEALNEAEEIQKKLQNLEIKNPTREDYEQFSNFISNVKKKDNDAVIEKITNRAMVDFTDRLAKYKSHTGKTVVLDDERRKVVKERLRSKLNELRDAEIKNGFKDYQKILRGLDSKWWLRYIYGSVESALALLGAYWLTKDLLDSGSSYTPTENPISQAYKTPLKMPTETTFVDTIWQQSTRMLNALGIEKPGQNMIEAVSKAIAKQNHIGVKIWGIAGDPLDVVMHKGDVIKLSDGWKVAQSLIQ